MNTRLSFLLLVGTMCLWGCENNGSSGTTTPQQSSNNEPIDPISYDPLLPSDEDRDGVPNDLDTCDSSWFDFAGFGAYRALVNPRNGCPSLVQPSTCLNDQSAPRVLLGESSWIDDTVLLGAGLEARLVDFQGRKVIQFEMLNADALETVDDCPVQHAMMWIAVKVNEESHFVTCPASYVFKQTNRQDGTARRVRSWRVGAQQVCVFDPAQFKSIGQETFDKAIEAGSVQLDTRMMISDGAGNTTEQPFGQWRWTRQVCRVLTKLTRDEAEVAIESGECVPGCDVSIADGPVNITHDVEVGDLPFVVMSPSIEASIQAKITDRCTQAFRVGASMKLEGPETLLATNQVNSTCHVEPTAEDTWTVRCAVRPKTVLVKQTRQSLIKGKIEIVVQYGTGTVTKTVPFEGKL